MPDAMTRRRGVAPQADGGKQFFKVAVFVCRSRSWLIGALQNSSAAATAGDCLLKSMKI